MCVTLEIFLNLLYHFVVSFIKIIVENMRWNRITFGDITVLSKTTFNLYKTVLCVLTLVAALLLVGCGGSDASIRAKASETVQTALFDFTCDTPRVVDGYNNITTPDGEKLVIFMMTVTNTSNETYDIFKDDFQIQWGKDDFGVALDAVDDVMMPDATTLQPGESFSGWMLVNLPQDTNDFVVAYQEMLADGSNGNAYFVDLSL